jgi:hypothetical protein
MKLKTLLIILITLGYLAQARSQNPIVQSILNDVEIDSMTFFIQQLSGEEQVVINGQVDTIFSRHKDQPGNEKAFQFVREKFIAYGLEVNSLQFSSSGKNLLGQKTGTLFPNRRFILGAHYDNVGLAVAPGADDNASGSAAVMEAARVFSDYSFPFTIVFALWDEEEQGLIGSTAYAESAVFNNDSIMGYINMDMLGWDGNNDSTADLHVRPVGSSLLLADKAIDANTIYGINLDLHIVNPGSSNTDHAPFWDNGFTAIGIDEEYDGDFNPFWHSPADSLGQFNIPFYEKCAKLAFATLAECATDIGAVSGIEHNDSERRSTIYPNPASSEILVSHNSTLSRIVIYNELGKLVIDQQVDNVQKMSLDVSNLVSGLYFLQIHSDSGVFVKRLVITITNNNRQ